MQESVCLLHTNLSLTPASPDTLAPTHSLTSSQAMILCLHTYSTYKYSYACISTHGEIKTHAYLYTNLATKYYCTFNFACQIKLTPCLQACSLSARTQALCQCSLNDLNAKSDDKRPLTPASVSLPDPSRPGLSLKREPHTPPVRVWWVRLRGSCQGVSLLPWTLVPCLGRSKASENWTSQARTTNSEAQKSATWTSQLTSWKVVISLINESLQSHFYEGWKILTHKGSNSGEKHKVIGKWLDAGKYRHAAMTDVFKISKENWTLRIWLKHTDKFHVIFSDFKSQPCCLGVWTYKHISLPKQTILWFAPQ